MLLLEEGRSTATARNVRKFRALSNTTRSKKIRKRRCQTKERHLCAFIKGQKKIGQLKRAHIRRQKRGEGVHKKKWKNHHDRSADVGRHRKQFTFGGRERNGSSNSDGGGKKAKFIQKKERGKRWGG